MGDVFFKEIYERNEGKSLGILQNERGFTHAEIAECAIVFAIVIFIVIGSIAAITEAREVFAKITIDLFK